MVNEHPEITEYRQHMERNAHVEWFMRGVEEKDYEEKVEEVFKWYLPRLYALAFADQIDMPKEFYRLIEIIEKDLQLDLQWESQTEDWEVVP